MKTQQIQILIVCLSLFSISYAQDYKFDKIVSNKFSTELFPNQEWTNVFNSKDDSYHMRIYTRNDSLVSRIFDTKRGLIQHFYIDKTDSLNLRFLKTEKFTQQAKDFKFEFSELIKEKNEDMITLNIRNEKGRKIAKYKFTIQKTDQNLFPIFKLAALETLLFTNIVPPLNFLVLKAQGKNISGNSIKYEVSSIKDFDMLVTIPK